MKNYVQDGSNLTLVAPTGGVTAGMPYAIGDIVVVAHEDAAEGEAFVGFTCGVFELATASSPTAGASAYITSANAIVSTASGNTKIGAFVEAPVAGVAKVWLTGQV